MDHRATTIPTRSPTGMVKPYASVQKSVLRRSLLASVIFLLGCLSLWSAAQPLGGYLSKGPAQRTNGMSLSGSSSVKPPGGSGAAPWLPSGLRAPSGVPSILI